MSTFSIVGNGVVPVNHSSFRNASGAVANGGNVTVSGKFDTVSVGNTAQFVDKTTVLALPGVQKAVAAGAFAETETRQFTVMKVATELGGVANLALQSGSSIPGLRRKVNSVGSVRTTFLSQICWNAGNSDLPTYTYTYSTTNQVFWSISGNATSLTADDAISSVANGRLLGELTYKTGAFVPVNDEYATQQ